MFIDIKAPIVFVNLLWHNVIFTGRIIFLDFLKNHYIEHRPVYSGIIISSAYVLVVLFGLGLTGACINPARCFGPAYVVIFLGDFNCIVQFFVFLLSTLIGSLLAALAYRGFFKKNVEIYCFHD